MLDAEASLRTLHAYVGILQGRLALARVSGSRRGFVGVTDADLAHAVVFCDRTTDGIDAILDRMAPALASTAAAVADLSCQREFELPRSPAAGHLQLVAAETDRTA